MVDKVWILTSEVNDYDQHGEYFRAVFFSEPTKKELEEHVDTASWRAYERRLKNFPAALGVVKTYYEFLLGGGGRLDQEHEWFNLKVVEKP